MSLTTQSMTAIKLIKLYCNTTFLKLFSSQMCDCRLKKIQYYVLVVNSPWMPTRDWLGYYRKHYGAHSRKYNLSPSMQILYLMKYSLHLHSMLCSNCVEVSCRNYQYLCTSVRLWIQRLSLMTFVALWRLFLTAFVAIICLSHIMFVAYDVCRHVCCIWCLSLYDVCHI